MRKLKRTEKEIEGNTQTTRDKIGKGPEIDIPTEITEGGIMEM
jgi:hypothetical protein